MEDGQRSFTVTRYTHVGQRQERFEDEGGKGRYVSREPMNAARKAARQVFREASSKNKSKALYLEIRETTRGTPSNLYTYKATHKRTSERKDVGGRVIDKKMKIEIVSVPSKQFKGGAVEELLDTSNADPEPEKTPEEMASEEFLTKLDNNVVYKHHKDEVNRWLREVVREMCSTQGRSDEEEVLMRISTEMIERFQKLFVDNLEIKACPTISMILQEFESVLREEQCLSTFSQEQRQFIRQHLIAVLRISYNANVQNGQRRDNTTIRGGGLLGGIVEGCLSIVGAMLILPVVGIIAGGRALFKKLHVSKEAAKLSEKTLSRLRHLLSTSETTGHHFFFDLPLHSHEKSLIDENVMQKMKMVADRISRQLTNRVRFSDSVENLFFRAVSENESTQNFAHLFGALLKLTESLGATLKKNDEALLSFGSKTVIFRLLAIDDFSTRVKNNEIITENTIIVPGDPNPKTVYKLKITSKNSTQVLELFKDLSNRLGMLIELSHTKYDAKTLEKVR